MAGSLLLFTARSARFSGSVATCVPTCALCAKNDVSSPKTAGSVAACAPIGILYARGDTSRRERPGNVAGCVRAGILYAAGDVSAMLMSIARTPIGRAVSSNGSLRHAANAYAVPCTIMSRRVQIPNEIPPAVYKKWQFVYTVGKVLSVFLYTATNRRLCYHVPHASVAQW